MNTAEVHHKDGVPWYEAPAPPKRHEHVAQTWGWHGPHGLTYTERCACGALSRGDDIWVYLDEPRVARWGR